METKRCAYCHKLQRADAQICSRCAHVFVQKKAQPFTREWTQPSIPPASPHRAGHYSGLHPEDQPYQSNKITVQHSTLQESESWHASLPEPEHIILPVTDPAVRRQVNILKYYDERSAKELPTIEEPFFYETRKWLLPRRVIPVLLIISCIFFLLASSILATVLIRKSASTPLARITTSSATKPSAFQLSASNLSFGVGAVGVVSDKIISLINSGRGQIAWHLSSDQPWLKASPASDVFSSRESVHVRVNRSALTPASYTGHMTFTSDNTSLILTATMKVKAATSTSAVSSATLTASPSTSAVSPSTPSVSSATLTVSPSTLPFTMGMGQQSVLKAIILSNTSNQPLNWSAAVSTTDQGHWLSAEPSSGTLGPGVEGYMNAEVNVQGLQSGSYQGTLTLSPGSGGVPQQVTILLTIS